MTMGLGMAPRPRPMGITRGRRPLPRRRSSSRVGPRRTSTPPATTGRGPSHPPPPPRPRTTGSSSRRRLRLPAVQSTASRIIPMRRSRRRQSRTVTTTHTPITTCIITTPRSSTPPPPPRPLPRTCSTTACPIRRRGCLPRRPITTSSIPRPRRGENNGHSSTSLVPRCPTRFLEIDSRGSRLTMGAGARIKRGVLPGSRSRSIPRMDHGGMPKWGTVERHPLS